jgi:hypothetical protein
MKLTKKQLYELRIIIVNSIGEEANNLTDEDIDEFGISLLEATVALLKAQYHLKRN